MGRFLSNATSTGKEGCQCIDESATLQLLDDRQCNIPNTTESGVMLAVDGSCVPYSYGSSSCLQHDYLHNPRCFDQYSPSESHAHCLNSWCYVDAKSCMRTPETVYRSTHFPTGEETKLFYSFSTCGYPEVEWSAMHNINVEAAVPEYWLPIQYKKNAAGKIITNFTEGTSEFYNNSIPWEGFLFNYLDDLQRISNGNLSMTFTYGSDSSKQIHKQSPFTAAILDIQHGLVDMAVGNFWVTKERLLMTAFSIPLRSDKTMLVMKNPETKSSLTDETGKIFAPFTWTVWILVVAVILVASLLSAWFSSRPMTQTNRSRPEKQSLRKKMLNARLTLDAVLQQGMFFCSASVDQDAEASLPHKLLMFGFAFFILIVVSAYVANLAASLTQPVTFAGTMKDVVASEKKICAHPALKDDLIFAWEHANFIFSESGGNYNSMIDDFIVGRCDVLAASLDEIITDVDLVNRFCDNDLVFVNSVVLENPIAFPVRAELASKLSYWIYRGDKDEGISLQASQEEYVFKMAIRGLAKCQPFYSAQVEDGHNASITPENLIFPALFFASFAVLAVVVQLYHQWKLKHGSKSSIAGRSSTLGFRPVRSIRRCSEDGDFQSRQVNVPTNNTTDANKNEHNSYTLGRKVSFQTDLAEEDADLLSNGGEKVTTRIQRLTNELVSCYQHEETRMRKRRAASKSEDDGFEDNKSKAETMILAKAKPSSVNGSFSDDHVVQVGDGLGIP